MTSLWNGLIRGANFVPPAVGAATTHTMPRLPPKPHVAKAPVPPPPVYIPTPFVLNTWRLSPTQLRVVATLATSKLGRMELARSLNMSDKTMDVHLSRARERMGAHTTQQAVLMYLRRNMERDLEQRRSAAEKILIERLQQQ